MAARGSQSRLAGDGGYGIIRAILTHQGVGMPRKYRKLATAKDLTRLMTRYYATRKVVGKVRPLA